jgi:hypothetical protein
MEGKAMDFGVLRYFFYLKLEFHLFLYFKNVILKKYFFFTLKYFFFVFSNRFDVLMLK